MYIGLDLSLSATGIGVIEIKRGEIRSYRHAAVSAPGPSRPKGSRLGTLVDDILDTAKRFVDPLLWRYDGVKWGIEGYAYGMKFAREALAEVHGAVLVSLYRNGVEPVYVTPRAVKAAACPSWPGWSRAHWERAGKKGPYSAKMPDKNDVIHGLFKNWRINAPADAEADALCVALAFAVQDKIISPRNDSVPAAPRNVRR